MVTNVNKNPNLLLFQWYCDDKGNWFEIDSARFTADNTGNKGYRMDYSGGLDKDSFYLKDGVFL